MPCMHQISHDYNTSILHKCAYTCITWTPGKFEKVRAPSFYFAYMYRTRYIPASKSSLHLFYLFFIDYLVAP